MHIGVTISVLLLCAVFGTFYFARLARARKLTAIKQQQEELARRKRELDQVGLDQIREKLKHEFAYEDSDLPMAGHFFELDDQGRTIYERLTDNLPELPPVQLHGEDLNTVHCPEFYSYKIPGQSNAA